MKLIALGIALVTTVGCSGSVRTAETDQGTLDGRKVQPEKKNKEDKDFVGLTVAEARQLAKVRGLYLRIAVIEGVDQMLTADWEPKRVNLVVLKGRVTHTSRG